MGELGGSSSTIDPIHGYRVQYDDAHDIFLFRDSGNCYIVEATSERWDQVVRDDATLHKFTEAVYHQILDNSGLTKISHEDAISTYHSRLEEWECRSRDVFVV